LVFGRKTFVSDGLRLLKVMVTPTHEMPATLVRVVAENRGNRQRIAIGYRHLISAAGPSCSPLAIELARPVAHFPWTSGLPLNSPKIRWYSETARIGGDFHL
jgi:hypothetical protein